MFGLKDILRMPESGADSLAGTTSIQDDVDLLNQEDETLIAEPEAEEVEIKEPGEEETEETEEETTTEELAPHDRPNFADLKNYDPDLFKNFPGLRDVMFRERAYTELFSNIEDARAAQENSEAFEVARKDILDGDGAAFLASIKDVDPKNLVHFAQNFLPSLWKVDQEAHWTAASPLLENIAKGFYNQAKDEDAKKAAQSFAEYVFGEQANDILTGKKSFIPAQTEKKEDPERVAFEKERYDTFNNSVRETASNNLRAAILSKDKNGNLHLDPEGIFSPMIKNVLVSEIQKEIDRQMVADENHMKFMNGLWKKAREAKFTSEWKSRIINAYLARARTLVQAARAKKVSEALGKPMRVSERQKTIIEKGKRPEAGGGGAVSRTNGKSFNPNRKIDYRKTTDDQILNDDITYKD